MKKYVFFIFVLMTFVINIYSQQIERKGWMGAVIEAITQENYQKFGLKSPQGVLIAKIVDGGTAQKMGLQTNDVWLSINNDAVESVEQGIQLISQKREGNDVVLQISRNGKVLKLKGKVSGKPRETSGNCDIVYESVPYKQGRLSIIINKPKKEGKMPAMLFIPGYNCQSLDNPTANYPYAKIIKAFSDAGFVVMRVEKSGMGDSQNTPDCYTTDLNDEIESFSAGLAKLKSLSYVDANNIILFGHSMGGVVAPAVDAKNPVKGIITYGTVCMSFYEYILEMNRLQIMLEHPDPITYEKECRLQTEMAYEFYIEKKKIQDIATTTERIESLKNYWGYDDRKLYLDRNQEYWRQIIDQPLTEYWKNTKAKVLVFNGGADFQAFSKADQEYIVYTVNYYHPNHATLVVLPETDHIFAKVGTMQNSFDIWQVTHDYQKLFDSFDTAVTTNSVDWAKKIIAE